MLQQLKHSLLFSLFTLSISVLSAQAPTPFWSENFTNGLPAGWATADGSGQNVLWTWCPNAAAGTGTAGCAGIYIGQLSFQATTAGTGTMVVNSDGAGNVPNNHVSRLTTKAINCTGKNAVFLAFQTYIGVYNVAADDGAVLRVSTNGTSWTEYQIFSGVTNAEAWSGNPEFPIIDISAQAANQANVFIQWQWTGKFEYMWWVDDVEIFDVNPAPSNDLGISAFFYPVSSFATPESQIAKDTFAFEALLTNHGSNPATNIVLTATVEEVGGATLFTESINIPSLEPGVTDSGFVFTNRYAPELFSGLYSISYTVNSDSADQRPLDNSFVREFAVTNDIFSKENGAQQGTRPAAGGDWAVANYYRMNGGTFDDYKATRAEFAFTTNEDEILPSEVEATIYLLKIKDDVAEDFSNFDRTALVSSSLEYIGLAPYSAPDSLTGTELQVVNIDDVDSGLPGVALEPGGRYLLTIEYAAENSVVFHAFNSDITYFFPSTFIFNTDWNENGFGGDANAVLRMYISLVSTTDEQVLPENTLSIFPNPVHETLQLSVEFAEPTDATITIADISGRVITMEDRKGLTNELLKYQLPQVASGTYLARIATANGTLTKKFVVQK